jgi:sensor domain CHASE-containing protein
MIGGYTERAPLGQKAGMRRTSFAPTRRRRSPVPFILILLAVLLVALLVYAWAKNSEVAPARIEQDVTNALAH